MADVFISYHRSESASALVARIVGELESAGISCWYDTKDPNPGYFIRTIVKEIERCKAFLFIWDEGANQSEYCISETYRAFRCPNRPLRVPFRVGKDFRKNEELEFYLERCQLFEGGESAETARTDELIKKIAAEIGPPPKSITPQPQPAPTPKVDPPPQPQPPSAKIIKRGECGDNVTYELDANGVLTISGEGPMRDFAWDDRFKRFDTPWWYERETISRARICPSVTSIGRRAFDGCVILVSVDISYSVTKIGLCAFRNCESLASVEIPYTVTSIGDSAFDGCASLASVEIPYTVTSIGDFAFAGCRNLKSVNVPARVKLGYNAFPYTTVIRRPPRKQTES